MDAMQYTDMGYWWSLVDARLLHGFIVGAIYGGAIGVSLALKKWWIPAILILLPVALAITSRILPATDSSTYRVFFMIIPVIAVCGFAYWLARTH